MRTRMVRNIGTAGGVLTLVAILFIGNTGYQKWSYTQETTSAYLAAEHWYSVKGVEIFSWDELAATEGTFASGPTYPDELKARDGSYVNLLAFGAPVDRGRYEPASILPLIPQLMLGAAPMPPTYKFLNRMLLTPQPLACYWGSNPPTCITVYAHLKEGVMEDIPIDTPILITGTLRLNSEPGKFFYVLENAEIAKTQ